jgi:hypothetical protein
MSGVFRNIDPPLIARRVCTFPPLVRGEATLAGWRGGGGSKVQKTPDTALYSIYVPNSHHNNGMIMDPSTNDDEDGWLSWMRWVA